MGMSVPVANVNALFANTTSGTPISSTVMDAAVADIVSTINDVGAYALGLVDQDKFSQLGIFNVMDATLGAKGDGVTDDAPAIQAAVDAAHAAGGGIVYFPAPSVHYQVNSIIEVHSNITLTGVNGKSMLKKPSTTFWLFFLDGVSNVIIENLVLDGGIPTANPDWSDEQKHTITMKKVSNSIIRNCVINNSGGDGIYFGSDESFNPSDNVIAENNVITKVGRNGVSLVGASRCTLLGNKISDCRGPVIGCGVDIEPNPGDVCINNQVIGNTFTNCKYGLTIAALNDMNDRTTYGHLIERNIAYGNEIGLQCAAINATYTKNIVSRNEYCGLNITAARYSVFEGNFAIDNGTDTGITRNGQYIIQNGDHIMFNGNKAYMTDPSADLCPDSVYVAGTATQVVITGNFLSPFKTGGRSIRNLSPGTIFMYMNFEADEATINKTIIDQNIEDFAKTFQLNMNFYKGIGTGKYSFRRGTPTSSTEIFSIDNSGNTDQIGIIKLGGIQVVGARAAAVADATDAASAITQLNLLLARCRTHGLIAP